MSGPTFLFTGGGSGGHLTPGITVAEELARRHPGCRILFVGPNRAIDREMLSRTPFEQIALPVLSPAAGCRHPFRFLHGNWTSWRAATQLLATHAPTVVIGLGGFASVPCAWAAVRQRVPLVLLEQNVIPGRATSALCRFADAVCLSYAATRNHLPGRVWPRTHISGNPIRVTSPPSHDSVEKRLLILGGSLGARGLNALFLQALPQVRERLESWQILHQTGTADRNRVESAYAAIGIAANVVAFLPNLPDLLPAMSLVVSRAGGTTLAELSAHAAPTLLVPLPGCVREHQRENARHYAQHSAALMVDQTIGPHQFAICLGQLLNDEAARRSLGHAIVQLAMPQATATVCDQIDRTSEPYAQSSDLQRRNGRSRFPRSTRG